MSTTGSDHETEEALAVWAFEAAMTGLPESEARRMVEGERFPEPDTPAWAEALSSLQTDDDDVVVYDPDEESAWLQSSASVALGEQR